MGRKGPAKVRVLHQYGRNASGQGGLVFAPEALQRVKQHHVGLTILNIGKILGAEGWGEVTALASIQLRECVGGQRNPGAAEAGQREIHIHRGQTQTELSLGGPEKALQTVG